MAIREYKCSSCGVMIEKIIPTAQIPKESIPCTKCGESAAFQPIPTSVGLLTENFSEQKIDITIGKDANRRWQDISDRNELREKVRAQSGEVGLSMVGRNEFAPLPETEKKNRTEALAAVTKDGFRHAPDTKTDRKILGTD